MTQQGEGNMTSERPRVSQEVIDNIIDEDLSHLPLTPVGRCVHPVMTQKIALDLRDAREENACLVEQILSRKPEAVEADLQRVMAENAELRAALEETKALIADPYANGVTPRGGIKHNWWEIAQLQLRELKALRAALVTARRDGWIAGRDAAKAAAQSVEGPSETVDAICALAPDTAEGE